MTDEKINLRNPAALSAALRGDWDNARIASTPGGIEAQEAAAQQDLIESQKLPKEGTTEKGHRDTETNQAQLERIGFVFGQEIDDLFVACQFPKGWTIEPTEHSMWSYVKDEQGRKRITVFYKGAFYDRRAHTNMECRFHQRSYEEASPDVAEREHIDWNSDARHIRLCCEIVYDHDRTVIFHSVPYAASDREAEQATRAVCEQWLNEHYPDYRNPFAYW
jgi:hypothetical protein